MLIRIFLGTVGGLRVDDANETLLAMTALGTIEEYWVWTADVDGECGELGWAVSITN